jgi:hypothetical protein
MSSLIDIIRSRVTNTCSITVKVDLALKRLVNRRTELAHSLVRLCSLKATVNRRKSILFEDCRGGVCSICPSPMKCKSQYNTQTRQWKKLDRASATIATQIDSIVTLGEALDECTRVLKKRLAYCRSLKSISSNTELDILIQARDMILNLKKLETKVSGILTKRGVMHVS